MTNRSTFARALAESMADDEEQSRPRPVISPEGAKARLQESFAAYNTPHTFSPGMIVRQKPQTQFLGLGDGDSGLRIVIEFLDEPIIWDGGNQTTALRERLDLVIGWIVFGDGRDSFIVLVVDSRRYEPVSDEEIARMGKRAEAA